MIAAAISSDKIGQTLMQGDIIRYTLTLTNHGSPASNVTLRSRIPAGAGYVSSEPAANVHTAGSQTDYIQWNAGSIAAEATTTFSFTVKVNPNARSEADRLRLFAMFDNGNPVPMSLTSPDPAQITPQLENLIGGSSPTAASVIYTQMSSNRPNAYVKPGDEITYTLTAVNSGGTAADNVTLRGRIPAGTAYIPVSGSAGIQEHTDAGSRVDYVQWNIPGIPAGGTASVSYRVSVELTAGDTPRVINNTGRYDSGGPSALDLNAPDPERQTSPAVNPFDPSGVASGVPQVSLSISSDKMGEEVAEEDEITYTLIAMNTGTADAVIVQRDYLPAGTELVPGSVSPAAQIGTNAQGSFLQWDSINLPAGGIRISSFRVRINNRTANRAQIQNIVHFSSGIGNAAPPWSDPNPGFSSNLCSNIYRRALSNIGVDTKLPKTGFAIGEKSLIPEQPTANRYQPVGQLTLHIPTLNLSLPIVGVPMTGNHHWDVTWLNENAGWLEGSAYPTWAGNTVLTAHVWNADNQPGPFADLKTLKYGDQLSLEAVDGIYIYEVRSNETISEHDIDALLKQETLNWLTLMTCENYDSAHENYNQRRIVRAILTEKK